MSLLVQIEAEGWKSATIIIALLFRWSSPTKQLDTTDVSIRKLVTFRTDRKFDILPADMQRVLKSLTKAHGEDCALTVIFTIKCAVGLHRAWHMTLLTAKILQQLKERFRFRLRLTWNLGVFALAPSPFSVAFFGFVLFGSS